MIVVKVGGSLYDLSDLGRRLGWFLATLDSPDCLLVPGGGATAEVVRAFDRDHRLGPGPAHWLALRACTLNAHFLASLLGGAAVVTDPRAARGVCLLDALAFVQADEGWPGCLPHHWDATSDAVAARAAVVAGASLVLLKSADLPAGLGWELAAAAGYVDPVFPGIVRRAGLKVRAVNLRAAPVG